MIDDHINYLGDNPLVGPHEPTLGPRFPDISRPYSVRLRRIAREYGQYPSGVYAACPSGSLCDEEFRKQLSAAGAQYAGSGLVPEAIAARQASIEVLAFAMPLSANYHKSAGAFGESKPAYTKFKEVSARILENIRDLSRIVSSINHN